MTIALRIARGLRRAAKRIERSANGRGRRVEIAAPEARDEAQDRLLNPPAPLESGPFEIERWNAEWVRYLGREWKWQLRPYTSYPILESLPESPLEMVEL